MKIHKFLRGFMLVVVVIFLAYAAWADTVTLSTFYPSPSPDPNAAALLDVSSTTLGFLPPRMTTAQRNAIANPPAGLMIYNTTINKLNFYNGAAWEAVTSA